MWLETDWSMSLKSVTQTRDRSGVKKSWQELHWCFNTRKSIQLYSTFLRVWIHLIFFDFFFFPFLFLLLFICLSIFSFIDFLHFFNNFVFSSVGTALFQAEENLEKKKRKVQVRREIINQRKKKSKKETNKGRKKTDKKSKSQIIVQFSFSFM